MNRWVAAAGVAILSAALPAAAQVTVTVAGPANNPIRQAIGTFTVSVTGLSPADLPVQLNLEIATDPEFTLPRFADTTVLGPTATITIPRLLPSRATLFWRAFALTATGGFFASGVTGPQTGPTQLELVSPNNPAGQSLPTKRPTFTWRTAEVPPAFGRWQFEHRIEETATGLVRVNTTDDTTLTLAEDLEANTSYRWRVTARLPSTGESVSVLSAASFVVLSADAPLATLLLNPFPSPLRLSTGASACIWFDLQTSGAVTLDILDGRGLLVRRIVPSAVVTSPLPAGRYGRIATGGCDERFAWNATDSRGRAVPPGRYLVRLVANGRPHTASIIVRSR